MVGRKSVGVQVFTHSSESFFVTVSNKIHMNMNLKLVRKIFRGFMGFL